MNNPYRQQLIEAGVLQPGHTRLNSGRHTNTKLYMERLLLPRNTMRLRMVLHGIAAVLNPDTKYVVPVPDGALALLQAEDLPNGLPGIIPARKLGKREFAFTHPAARQIIRTAGRLAIFDDVLTTGATPLAMAETIRSNNPDVRLDLIAIWRRDDLLAKVAETFETQTYLVEEHIASWQAEECQICPLG